jgi:hypothetical protein
MALKTNENKCMATNKKRRIINPFTDGEEKHKGRFY